MVNFNEEVFLVKLWINVGILLTFSSQLNGSKGLKNYGNQISWKCLICDCLDSDLVRLQFQIANDAIADV